MVKVSRALKELIDKWDVVGGRVAEITELEHAGDTITHQIIAQVHRTFVTPFDREDIALLAHTMDDVTDFIHAAADAMLTYKVERPTEKARELVDNVFQAVEEVERAVFEIRGRIDRDRLLRRCVEINRLEDVGDKLFRSAMAELFADSTDFAHVVKWREIYMHMESATDRCEDVANVLEGIALKYA